MRSTRYAIGFALGYVALATTYIVVSSRLAASFASDVTHLESMEKFKGVGFVLITGLVMLFAVRAVLRRFEDSAAELLRRERALLANERRVFAGLMASSVAHDANNVLMTVLMELERMRDPAHRDQVDRLKNSVGQLVQLNKRLLQAGRHEIAGEQHPIDLTRTVQDAVDIARSHHSVRESKLTVEAPEGLIVKALPVLVHQVVTNLVVNAGEATGGKGRVLVKVHGEPGVAVLEVQDDGPGIPAQRRDGLFEALASTKPEGNGLGLFSVKACVQALEGTVEVTDSALGGACFRVRLPV